MIRLFSLFPKYIGQRNGRVSIRIVRSRSGKASVATWRIFRKNRQPVLQTLTTFETFFLFILKHPNSQLHDSSPVTSLYAWFLKHRYCISSAFVAAIDTGIFCTHMKILHYYFLHKMYSDKITTCILTKELILVDFSSMKC